MSSSRKDKILDLPDLLLVRAEYRCASRTVVWSNGCFDIVHAGHILNLQAAAALGDVLIVGVNSDDSVRRLKGAGRPILAQQDRIALLAALECVDHVVLFAEDTPTAILEQVQPDIHCKGSEYAPPHGRPIPEKATVERHGGRVVFLPLLEGVSTSEVIRRIRAAGTESAPVGRWLDQAPLVFSGADASFAGNLTANEKSPFRGTIPHNP